MATLAELMQRARQRRALTQEDAAEDSGIPVSSWQRYEAGRGVPAAYNARTLAAWLQVSPAEIMTAINGGRDPNFADLLREAMGPLMTQEELAERVEGEVSLRSIQRYCRGGRPLPHNARVLADALNIDMARVAKALGAPPPCPPPLFAADDAARAGEGGDGRL